MIEEPTGLTIAQHRRRPSAAQIAAFQGTPTGQIADAMGGSAALDPAIRALGDGIDVSCVMAGPALTADNAPGDILATLAALTLIQPGDILVASNAGHTGVAVAGDRVMGMLRNAGGAGFVADGPVRDYPGIVEVGLPVFCTGLCPDSPFSTGPGRVGMAMSMAGRRIDTGDMIVADRDGVVVVPFDDIDAVLERLQRIALQEQALDAEVREGLIVPERIRTMLDDPAVTTWTASRGRGDVSA